MKDKNYKILLYLLASIVCISCKIQKIEQDVLTNLLETNVERNLKDNERPKPCICSLSDKKVVVITNNDCGFLEIENDSCLLNSLKTFNSFSKDMYEDFMKKNKSIRTIKLNKVDNKEVSYITQQKINKYLQNDNWQGYNTTIVGSPVFHISRPGLNNTKSKALVYLSITKGKLSGTGYYFILEKQQNQWNIIECYLAWMS
ncbi:hypothetical protein [Plebeiibacterium sediminum]|uniref:Uncharacterized protein n=1 Tax=Plebeiibacterium sediminum TaxID=2992112 RepID=A0AAE3M426_9BACT|nr:hypothetical protein [Plebeiobacterium sediminum]MCW3786325.1 hypothetical protein [Plebeiobacterium sediminum]